MVKGYDKFNESRNNRNKGGKHGGNRFQNNQRRNWLDEVKPMPGKVVDSRGMPMDFSERFKYVLTKIANKKKSNRHWIT